MITLMDILKANAANDGITGLIDESIAMHPELKLFGSRTIKGVNYKTLVRTGLGNTSGSFRSANQGSAPIQGTYENRLVECFIMEPRFQVDKAVAATSEEGPEAYIAMEIGGILEGEMQALCKQMYYGATTAGGNSKGFPGLIDLYDSTNFVVDAGGTTSSTGSSCWLVRSGPQQIQWVWGDNGSFSFSPIRTESVFDPTDNATPPTKKFDAWVQTMLARPGLQVGSLWSAVRIKKLTADSGKGLTDALISKALALFKAGTQPDYILCSRRSLQQLQASRTPTTTTGAPAPFPTAFSGIGGQNIPIYVTDSISNTESLTL